MSAFDLIIFDCDGVLIESEAIAIRVESALFRERGADISPEEVASRYVGTSEAYMYADVEERFGIVIDRTEIRSSFDEKFWPLAESTLTAVDGVSGFVQSLNHDRCVCSNSSLNHIKRCLEIVELGAFDPAHLFAARDHGEGKPAPDVFLHAAKIFDVDPARCLIIEDSPSGVKGGHVAGMSVAGFVGGSHCTDGHDERLTEAGAKFATHDWNVILDFIHA